MARPIVLSNGTMHVGINFYGLVHDLYYPFVGHENHCAAKQMRNRIGVWCEGEFSWLDDDTWQFHIDYEPGALISHMSAYNPHLAVALEFSDCVDSHANIFMRNIHVVNGQNKQREIRLFMQTAILISNSLDKDTSQYLPGSHAILHYKGNRAFVIGGKTHTDAPYDQFSIGQFNGDTKQGTFRDAEDGLLAGNVVEYGTVDSVIGFNLRIDALNSSRVHYWLAAGKSQHEAVDMHNALRNGDVNARFARTAAYWHRWLQPAEKTISQFPKEHQATARKNLLIIKSHIDHKGGVIASTDTTKLNYEKDAYAYCWPRDACYALWPLLRLGYKSELKNFFTFCKNALTPEGFLMHKYLPDGKPGSSWHPYIIAGRVVPPIQEDETALVIFLLGQFVQQGKDKKTLAEFYDSLVVPATNFMATYIDQHTSLPHATYDLWEEKFLTTTYTTALVHAALTSAVKMAEKMKRPDDVVRWQTVADEMFEASHKLLFNKQTNFFYKGFVNHGEMGLKYDDTIDVSSFYGAFMYGLFEPDSREMVAAHQTLQKVFHVSDTEVMPLSRYEYDQYDTVDPSGLGNPWFVTTFWMAQYAIERGNAPLAAKTIEWAKSVMLLSGVLSEQVNPYDNRKFLSVAPLIWSQAEFINTLLDLQKKPPPVSGGT